MTVPFMSLKNNQNNKTYQSRIHPLEDPLNYGALADFSEMFEAAAKFRTWLRNKKRTRIMSPDASSSVNRSAMEAIFQK